MLTQQNWPHNRVPALTVTHNQCLQPFWWFYPALFRLCCSDLFENFFDSRILTCVAAVYGHIDVFCRFTHSLDSGLLGCLITVATKFTREYTAVDWRPASKITLLCRRPSKMMHWQDFNKGTRCESVRCGKKNYDAQRHGNVGSSYCHTSELMPIMD